MNLSMEWWMYPPLLAGLTAVIFFVLKVLDGVIRDELEEIAYYFRRGQRRAEEDEPPPPRRRQSRRRPRK